MLNRVLFCLVAIAGWLAESGVSTSVPPRLPHVYPDGFVERSLAIVIRDGRAYGEYSIGLNETTAGQVLEQARENMAKKTQGQTVDDANSTAAIPALNSPPASEPSATSDVAKQPADQQSDASSGEGEHLTDPDVIQQFAQTQAGWFKPALSVKLDQASVALENVEIEPAPRHPFSIIVKFEFDLSSDQQSQAQENGRKQGISLEVVDQLFPEQDGAIRYALKTRGRAMLLRSNVAPILVRAQRHELSGWESEKRNKMSRIDARLAISPKRN